MMKKLLALVFAVIVCAGVLTGCKKSVEGIITVGGSTGYIIDLDEASIGQYFTKTGTVGETAVSGVNMGTQVIRYSRISEGGWIVYTDDRVLCIPTDVEVSVAKTACGALAMSSSFMSIEQAGEYISWLGK